MRSDARGGVAHEIDADEEENAPAEPGTRTAQVADAFRQVLLALDLDLSDPNLTATHLRVARAYEELFAGLREGSEPRWRTFPNTEQYSQMVSVVDVPFFSLCSHHFLPFFGSAHVAYIPGDRIVGLSKLARVVEMFARRPQVQERLTQQIANWLDNHLAPRGVGVVLEAEHSCMTLRGVQAAGATTSTSSLRGLLRESPQSRAEFFASLPS